MQDAAKRIAAWISAAFLTQKTICRKTRKHHFVKGFHRGMELYGHQADRLDELGYREAVAELGVIVVEGPNDVITLDALQVPAVRLCSIR